MTRTPGRAAGAALVEELLALLADADRMVLVRLAEEGRGQELPPTFRGRCLDPVYLDAVATGDWTLDDETLLAKVEERLEHGPLSRVRRADRRALRAVLRGTVLAVLTQDVAVGTWPARRLALAVTWERVVGPLQTTGQGPVLETVP